jgi:hypothetical protein
MMRKTVVLVVSMVCAFGLLQIAHAGFGDGLTCPPGWSVSEPNENDLIKQCVAPGQNAFIELYAAHGNQIPLGQLMDGWATQMAQRGLPFQQQLSENTGQVSGFPALVREYRGKVQAETFDSSIVVCHRGGVNYVFQALYLYGNAQIKDQARHSMNSWYFPDAGTTSSQSSPLAGLMGGQTTPHRIDPGRNAGSGNRTPHFRVPVSLRVETVGPACSGTIRVYDNYGDHILDLTRTYMGDRPFTQEHVGWNVNKHPKRNFFKLSITNYSNSPITFKTRARKMYSNKIMNWSRMPDGREKSASKYRVGYSQYRENGPIALKINRQYTNTLPPGQTSVTQTGFYFDVNDYKGKVTEDKFFILYKGKELSFDYCWKFR